MAYISLDKCVLYTVCTYLEYPIVSLQFRHFSLNHKLLILVVENIIAYFTGKVEVNITDFGNVQILCNDDVKTLGEGEEKEAGLDCNAGQTATTGESYSVTMLLLWHLVGNYWRYLPYP